MLFKLTKILDLLMNTTVPTAKATKGHHIRHIREIVFIIFV